MKRVIIESPYSASGGFFNVESNLKYCRACIRDSLFRGESPVAFHHLYTLAGVLYDDIPEQRKMGMQAAFAWYEAADLVAVYQDAGLSAGMIQGIAVARENNRVIQYRKLPNFNHRDYERV